DGEAGEIEEGELTVLYKMTPGELPAVTEHECGWFVGCHDHSYPVPGLQGTGNQGVGWGVFRVNCSVSDRFCIVCGLGLFGAVGARCWRSVLWVCGMDFAGSPLLKYAYAQKLLHGRLAQPVSWERLLFYQYQRACRRYGQRLVDPALGSERA